MIDLPESAELPTIPLRRHRVYQAVIWSQTCTDTCEQFLIMAITWAALHEFGSARLGLVLAAWAIPRGVLLLFGGVLVDRSDKRSLTAVVGCLLCALTVLAAVVTSSGNFYAWISVAIGLGVLDAVRLPVSATMLPSYLNPLQLVNANRWNGMREWATLAAGPAVGGGLVAAIGTYRTLLVSAALYLISAALMVLVPAVRAPSEEERGSVLADLRGGLRYVMRDVQLRVLLPGFALANLFVLGLMAVAVPVFAKNVLHSGPQGLGALSASLGVGLVVGTLGCSRLPERWKTSQRQIFLLFMVSDLMLGAVGVMPNLATGCAAYLLSGLFAGPAATFYRTLLQTIPPANYLGRVNSIARATSFGLEPISVSMVGGLTARLSARTILVAGGLIAAAVDFTGSALSTRAGADVEISDADAAVAGP
ncbi:MFS transporter [Jatrophihabitans sp.]|uniref:MFS transporter n=1 Tax=Jatrophihabitans sp. TaxID=1932789 RepID=UPI002C310FA4|nr:MFS transporter [Jatrophihabitans sp.]